MAKITVRKNFKSFADLLGDVTRTAADLKAEGEVLIDRIRERTAQGLDEDRKRFEPYAASTLRQSDKRANTRGPIVDLEDSGKMLDDLTVINASKRKLQLGFRTRRSERIAELHERGTRNMPARRFFGIPQTWVDDMLRRLRRRR